MNENYFMYKHMSDSLRIYEAEVYYLLQWKECFVYLVNIAGL